MIKHVLIPLDRSELSECALQYARQIVEPGSRIILLHVLEDLVIYRFGQEIRYPADVEIDLIEDAAEYLHKFGDQLMQEGYGIECLVRGGRPDHVITRLAEKRGVDAIVMASHSRSSLKRLVLGSVTRAVVKHATCPVFVVPESQVMATKAHETASV